MLYTVDVYADNFMSPPVVFIDETQTLCPLQTAIHKAGELFAKYNKLSEPNMRMHDGRGYLYNTWRESGYTNTMCIAEFDNAQSFNIKE